MKGTGQNQVITPHADRMDLAIIQRQTLTEEDRIVIYACGNGSNGTKAAIRYLAENWGELYKHFHTDDFAVCIQCEERELNPNGYHNWNVIRIVPEIDRISKKKLINLSGLLK